MSYLKVDGHPDLIKDQQTGVILNTNSNEVKAARARKKAWKEKQNEVDELKSEVSELKQMMKQVLEKLNGA